MINLINIRRSATCEFCKFFFKKLFDCKNQAAKLLMEAAKGRKWMVGFIMMEGVGKKT